MESNTYSSDILPAETAFDRAHRFIVNLLFNAAALVFSIQDDKLPMIEAAHS